MGRILYPAALLLLCAGTVMADSQERSADDTFRTAERLYSLRRYDEAEPHFARIATICESTRRGECGLYYLAECQYQQKKYIAAFESFERLHSAYPGSDFREQIVGREYEMAEIWLARANGERPQKRVVEASGRIDSPLTPTDFRELALRAFIAVRHNDPTGVKAGDAAIRIAQYYMSIHDYDSAGIYYEQFIGEYCKSPMRTTARIGRLEALIRGFVAAHWVLVSVVLALVIVFFSIFCRALGRRVIV
jgi:tetratricopeptide (TPR) repeat protein